MASARAGIGLRVSTFREYSRRSCWDERTVKKIQEKCEWLIFALRRSFLRMSHFFSQGRESSGWQWNYFSFMLLLCCGAVFRATPVMSEWTSTCTAVVNKSDPVSGERERVRKRETRWRKTQNEKIRTRSENWTSSLKTEVCTSTTVIIYTSFRTCIGLILLVLAERTQTTT